MVGGKGIEGWGMELGNFGGEVGEVGEVGEREGERLSWHLVGEVNVFQIPILAWLPICV